MWPVTRRICANVADPRLTAAVIETLETRRLLTAAADAATAAHWELRDDAGALQGTATLEDGILKVTATDGNDEMTLGTLSAPGRLYVMVNRASVTVDAADLRGIQIDAAAGDDCLDFFNFGGLVDVPVTVVGGAGNDSFVAQRDRNNYDEPIAFAGQGPFAPVTLIGGDGDDDLHAGIGDCYMDGGAGTDTFEHGWGHDKIRDKDKTKADGPAQATAPTDDHTAPPATLVTRPAAAGKGDDHTVPATMPATTVPPAPFCVLAVAGDADTTLLHGTSDDRFTA